MTISTRVITTYKMPDSALAELRAVGQSDHIPTAIDNIRRAWDHNATMIAYMLHDYRDDINPLSVDLDVSPHILAHALRIYDPQYGIDALPVYDKGGLIFLDEEFQQDFALSFSFDLSMRAKPRYVLYNGLRYHVRDEQCEHRMAVLPPIRWNPNPEPASVATDYHEVRIMLKTFGFTARYQPHVEDDTFEHMMRYNLDSVKYRFEQGEGQEQA